MNISRLISIIGAAVVVSSATAQEAAPKLPLSQAAKLAEDAIAAASLPADCFLRSITLSEKDGVAFYQGTYKPTVRRRVKVDSAPEPITIDFIRLSMDGKVTFESEEMAPRRRIITK